MPCKPSGRLWTQMLAVLIAVLLPSCAFIRSIMRGDAPGSGESPPLNGAFLKAAYVAANDLVSENSLPAQSNPDAGIVHQCLARWENYEIAIKEGEDRYFVSVQPRIGDCVEGGERLIGGGGAYEVSKEDFSILKKRTHDQPTLTSEQGDAGSPSP
jgi:hypothetical protein